MSLDFRLTVLSLIKSFREIRQIRFVNALRDSSKQFHLSIACPLAEPPQFPLEVES